MSRVSRITAEENRKAGEWIALCTERDSLIKEYEDLNDCSPESRFLPVMAEKINALHDAIYDLEVAINHPPMKGERDMGEWGDKTSKWHY